MQSPEYPDLPFVRPRAWGRGRDGKDVRYIVVHYTAGSEGPVSAENGAAYDTRRTDGTSCHYHVDSNSVVQCVETWNRSNSALHKGNRLGIQYELAGTAQTRAQWLDPVSDATLWKAARQMARDCAKYGIPVRRLSVAETRSAWYQFPGGPKGFVGHVDVTYAYPEDGGDHTDPGAQFPWDVLLSRVQQCLTPTASVSGATPRRRHRMIEYLWNLPGGSKYAVERPYHDNPAMQWEELGSYAEAVGVAKANANTSELDQASWDRRKARYAT
jgi:hypothetical protein